MRNICDVILSPTARESIEYCKMSQLNLAHSPPRDELECFRRICIGKKTRKKTINFKVPYCQQSRVFEGRGGNYHQEILIFKILILPNLIIFVNVCSRL